MNRQPGKKAPGLKKQKQPKKKLLKKKTFTQKRTDREGNGNMDQNVGPLSVGLPGKEEEGVTTQVGLAQTHPNFSAQLSLELRGSQSRTQHLSQKGLFKQLRNRGKHYMLVGARRVQLMNGKKRRTMDQYRPDSSKQKKKESSMEGVSIGDSNIANVNRIFIQNQHEIEAKKIWELGKRLGAHVEGNEDKVVEKIRCMEEKD
ncbi:hypothetical protein Ancab_025623 [Ancistrocladus abbreviatus]